jgi:hypothetical protein
MAVVDTVRYGAHDVTNNTETEIKPSGTDEVVIHEFTSTQGALMELYRSVNSGTNYYKFWTLQGGSMFGEWRATNAAPLKMKNISGSTVGNTAIGVQVK